MALPALPFLRTLAARSRNLERSLSACLHLRKPGAALELTIDKRNVGSRPGHELPGSTWTAGPPPCGWPAGPGVLSGSLPSSLPRAGSLRPREATWPCPRCVPQSPRPRGLLWAPEAPLECRFVCRYTAVLRTKNKVCVFKKETTQTVKFQSCMMTSPGVTKQPQDTGFPPPPYPHFLEKGSRVGRWGRAEPNLEIPCLQPIYRRVQKGSQGHACAPFLHGLIP